jgi:hypothetical protein
VCVNIQFKITGKWDALNLYYYEQAMDPLGDKIMVKKTEL